jgi:hypothetical protein
MIITVVLSTLYKRNLIPQHLFMAKIFYCESPRIDSSLAAYPLSLADIGIWFNSKLSNIVSYEI